LAQTQNRDGKSAALLVMSEKLWIAHPLCRRTGRPAKPVIVCWPLHPGCIGHVYAGAVDDIAQDAVRVLKLESDMSGRLGFAQDKQ